MWDVETWVRFAMWDEEVREEEPLVAEPLWASLEEVEGGFAMVDGKRIEVGGCWVVEYIIMRGSVRQCLWESACVGETQGRWLTWANA